VFHFFFKKSPLLLFQLPFFSRARSQLFSALLLLSIAAAFNLQESDASALLSFYPVSFFISASDTYFADDQPLYFQSLKASTYLSFLPLLSMTTCLSTASLTLLNLPDECQVHILSFLRAYDLAPLVATCRFYRNEDRIHKVVTYFAQHVYGPKLTKGIVTIDEDAAAAEDDSPKPRKKSDKKFKKVDKKEALKTPPPNHESSTPKYTLQHLRSIELTVVARVLSLPEPKTGFYVSKSWVKKTLLWLEAVNEPPANSSAGSSNGKNPKKLSKKQQRQRSRRLSDVSPPWPDANSDILCEHQNLQRCGAKSARSRRKLMDKHSWKVLRKLYPDSTTLESVGGECLQCLMETEAAKKTEIDRLEQEKLERKKPLANPHVRRFYTRTKGVPTQCLVENSGDAVATASLKLGSRTCPLTKGRYVILPRAWCHQWRRYMKTGEGSMPFPPESSALLCDAHKLALLPVRICYCAYVNELGAFEKHDGPCS
jgi:hypothetical protein